MYGNILYGGTPLGDTLFGVHIGEVTANIYRSHGGVLLRATAVFSSYPAKLRIPDLDVIIDLATDGGKYLVGIGIGGYGNFEEFGTVLYHGLRIGGSATFIPSRIVAKGPGRLAIHGKFHMAIVSPDDNAIIWSQIGSMDFTIDQSNVAGKRPLLWKGYTYAILQMGNTDKILVYGVNGVSLLRPSGIYYGEAKVSNLGLKNKSAVVRTQDNHYCILTDNNLYKVGVDGFELLGYSEFLAPMGDTVMMYNPYREVIYICDSTQGYIYSLKNKSMSSWLGGITGAGYQDKIEYFVSPSYEEFITMPHAEICTGVYDFGTRKAKTIRSIEVGTDHSGLVFASMDYRIAYGQEFITLPWKTVIKNGETILPCYGVEFKFRIKAEEVEIPFVIDSLKINGNIHKYDGLNSRGSSDYDYQN